MRDAVVMRVGEGRVTQKHTACNDSSVPCDMLIIRSKHTPPHSLTRFFLSANKPSTQPEADLGG